MNKHERYIWNESRSQSLPVLIARLVEAYECHAERSAAVMRFKYLPGRHLESQNPVDAPIGRALDQSDSHATRDAFEKMLHEGSPQRRRYSDLLDCWYQGNADLLMEELNDDLASGDFAWLRTAPEKERFDKAPENIARMMESPNLASYLLKENEQERARYQEEAELIEKFPSMKEEWAKRYGVDRNLPSDEFVRRRDLAFWKQMEEDDLASLRAPSAIVFWAKDLVGRLAELIEREDALDRYPVLSWGEAVPSSLRMLFEEAHLAFLFGLEIPCTLTCGALIEEAFQIRFRAQFENWDRGYKEAKRIGKEARPLAFWQKIDAIVEQHPFAKLARQHANSVWDSRTSAMHRPEEYLRQERYRAKDALYDSRKTIKILFAPERSDERGK